MFALEFGELFSRKSYIHYRLLYGKCNIPYAILYSVLVGFIPWILLVIWPCVTIFNLKKYISHQKNSYWIKVNENGISRCIK